MIAYLNDRDDIGSRGFEFGQIDIEMVELVLFSFVQDDVGSFPDCMDAS
jgi:hypothetical protein